ncbi:calcium-binding protein [Microvirga sp. RSM25]|uniref:calcium-binding protein n=1 Tax=Microvirga sp. RSM25 TaxID=3273802 RepID=UPI00384E2AF6
MTFSLEQALEAFFNNSGGGGAGYGGTYVVSGPITGGGSSSGNGGGGAGGTTNDGDTNGDGVPDGPNGPSESDEGTDVPTVGYGEYIYMTFIDPYEPIPSYAIWQYGQESTWTVLDNPQTPIWDDSDTYEPYRLFYNDSSLAWHTINHLFPELVPEQPDDLPDLSSPSQDLWNGYQKGVLIIPGEGSSNIVITTSFGTAGNDALSGGGALFGGAGNDGLTGSAGADMLSGGTGHDWLDGGVGGDVLDGGEGWDVASYMSATGGITVDLTSNANSGAASGDTILNMEVLQGSNYADMLTGIDRGNGSGVQLYGEGGDDGLTGKAGGDALFGGAGNDWLDGGPGGDILDGGAGWDVLSYQSATSGVVVDMTTNANGGAATGDVISNIEVLQGSNFADTLTSLDRGGGSGAQIYGEGGNDTLLGKGGGDYLFGGAGNDLLDSGFGGDVLNGGIGADTFRFSTALGAGNVDTVQDFWVSQGDRIVLSRQVFAAAGYDALASAAFALGTAATTAAHRIVYNQSTGDLSYDADGVGGVAAIKFAVIATHAQLSAASFQIL